VVRPTCTEIGTGGRPRTPAGPPVDPDQELGRLPWLAAEPLRAFFLRARLPMWIPHFSVVNRGEQPFHRAMPGRVRRPWFDDTWFRAAAGRPLNRPESQHTTTATTGAPPMAEQVQAEMVANVWKVLVSAGDTVAEGDTLVILESMKMEIPVIAEVDGTVSKVAVSEGQVVQEGDLIAEIDD
jgi:biotin carboxyl carrier protein